MIQTLAEFQKAQVELTRLDAWLRELAASAPNGSKGFTKAGVHKMIARIHEELADFEGCQSISTLRQST